jgi:hypothetical protein
LSGFPLNPISIRNKVLRELAPVHGVKSMSLWWVYRVLRRTPAPVITSSQSMAKRKAVERLRALIARDQACVDDFRPRVLGHGLEAVEHGQEHFVRQSDGSEVM